MGRLSGLCGIFLLLHYWKRSPETAERGLFCCAVPAVPARIGLIGKMLYNFFKQTKSDYFTKGLCNMNNQKTGNRYETIYERLRKAVGYSQEKAAELLHIGLRTLQSYEEGERSPSFETAVKVADLYMAAPSSCWLKQSGRT